MPKYNVLVTAEATCSTIVDVEASTAEEAERLALEEARGHSERFDWTLDEGNDHSPYIADPGNAAELQT